MSRDFVKPVIVVRRWNCKPPLALLKPIPGVSEPFSQVVIDCVGPLPKTPWGLQSLPVLH